MSQLVPFPDKSPEETLHQYLTKCASRYLDWQTGTKMAFEDADENFVFEDSKEAGRIISSRRRVLLLHGYRVEPSLMPKFEGGWTPIGVLKEFRGAFAEKEDAWDFCWQDYLQRRPDDS